MDITTDFLGIPHCPAGENKVVVLPGWVSEPVRAFALGEVNKGFLPSGRRSSLSVRRWYSFQHNRLMLIIGSKRFASHVVCPDSGLSGQHAVVAFDQQAYAWITDINPTSTTYVDGLKILNCTPTLLKPGAFISFMGWNAAPKYVFDVRPTREHGGLDPRIFVNHLYYNACTLNQAEHLSDVQTSASDWKGNKEKLLNYNEYPLDSPPITRTRNSSEDLVQHHRHEDDRLTECPEESMPVYRTRGRANRNKSCVRPFESGLHGHVRTH